MQLATYTKDSGLKVFHLVAEPVKQQILPGKVLDLWGFNGSAPGPTIQVNQGDRVRIVVDNHLPEPTSMHWHGFEIPISMDGMPGVSQLGLGTARASTTKTSAGLTICAAVRTCATMSSALKPL